ncbi:MAG: VOC family protein [Candidatus Binatia bacterium]
MADPILQDLAKRPVSRLGRLLAAVPSAATARKAWRRLGFEILEPRAFAGCVMSDLILPAGGLRFLSVDPTAPSSPLSTDISRRLADGAGLVGWTWACEDLNRSHQTLEERSGLNWPTPAASMDGWAQVPEALTPGAATFLEQSCDSAPVHHPNGVTSIDHLVLRVSDTKAVAHCFEQGFGLKARHAELKERLYAFLKVGSWVLELVGPLEPRRGPLAGRLWGVAFRSSDLDLTLGCMRDNGVETADPHDAIQGGRIVSLPMTLGGINVAFMGA